MSEKDALDEILAGGLGKWFEGRSLAELEVTELNGEPLFPDTITRLDLVNKKLFDCPVYMRITQPWEEARARVSALSWMATESKRDPRSFSWTDAVGIFGEAHANHIEIIEVLSRSLRKRKDPSQVYMTPENLQACHPAPALVDAFNRIAIWRKFVDVRVSETEMKDPDVFWRFVAAVAKAGHVGPLAATDGPGAEICIVTMASQLHASRMQQSSQPSAESSTSTDTPKS